MWRVPNFTAVFVTECIVSPPHIIAIQLSYGVRDIINWQYDTRDAMQWWALQRLMGKLGVRYISRSEDIVGLAYVEWHAAPAV